MVSQLGWMDHDDSERRRMLAAIELFKDEGTVDELGFGAVRDTISRALFPGVSVLHTRARYLLFIPWCVGLAAASGRGGDAGVRELRKQELQLLGALLKGSDQDGLIGRVAGDTLKRLPSEAYWSVLKLWEIRRASSTRARYFRDAKISLGSRSQAMDSDDPEAGAARSIFGFDPSLPQPPAGLTAQASFELTAEESSYLAEQWRMTAPNSLLPWTLDHGVEKGAQPIWQHPRIDTAPKAMRELVELGRQFSDLTYGATLLYNMLMAQKLGDNDKKGLAESYREQLTDWGTEVAASGTVQAWNPNQFWPAVKGLNPNLRLPTRALHQPVGRLPENPRRHRGQHCSARADR